MEYIVSFFVAVMAGVVCHFVCKWLESNSKQQLTWYVLP